MFSQLHLFKLNENLNININSTLNVNKSHYCCLYSSSINYTSTQHILILNTKGVLWLVMVDMQYKLVNPAKHGVGCV